ncbi:hypothetical protein [Myxococcus sp. RHSTA-1-4]|uniref:hypothetical protein n=1 Tax=Myxococcus sp. RHSTA-1-4 TaxID=2874601 RepID=UPI001CC1749A|nr:hypothetical protein [Myxococcus sp. RHSTA-1-4]MBZ4415749.1 hypothetical protein [Myxococcus sp. RHSTA-1-4]
MPRLIAVALVSLAAGVALGQAFLRSAGAHEEQVYQRQLSGELSAKEKEIEAPDPELDLARARLETRAQLEQQYRAQLTKKDEDFEAFRKSHGLRVQSLSNALFELQQQARNGTAKAQVVEPASRPGECAPDLGQTPIAYEYADADGRVRLTDPNIWLQGDERLTLTQRFRVRGTVLRQVDGSLMTDRVELIEISPKGEGKPRELARAALEDASFSYANAPHEVPPPGGSSPSWMVTLAASPDTDFSLRFGPSARLVRLGRVGFAAGLTSDFKSLEGTGAEAFLTYTPSVGGRVLNLALGGGIHLPVGGYTRVRPSLSVNFIID